MEILDGDHKTLTYRKEKAVRDIVQVSMMLRKPQRCEIPVVCCRGGTGVPL